MPHDFQKFLNNGENKERLFDLFEETYIQRKDELNERQIFFARKDIYKLITSTAVNVVCVKLTSLADTKERRSAGRLPRNISMYFAKLVHHIKFQKT